MNTTTTTTTTRAHTHTHTYNMPTKKQERTSATREQRNERGGRMEQINKTIQHAQRLVVVAVVAVLFSSLLAVIL